MSKCIGRGAREVGHLKALKGFFMQKLGEVKLKSVIFFRLFLYAISSIASDIF